MCHQKDDAVINETGIGPSPTVKLRLGSPTRVQQMKNSSGVVPHKLVRKELVVVASATGSYSKIRIRDSLACLEYDYAREDPY